METHIGDLVLTSELTSSNWGDKHLFFRHQVARARHVFCLELYSPLLTTGAGHGGGRGAGAGLGAVPRQVRAGARVRVPGGREDEAGEAGGPSLDCSLSSVQY